MVVYRRILTQLDEQWGTAAWPVGDARVEGATERAALCSGFCGRDEDVASAHLSACVFIWADVRHMHTQQEGAHAAVYSNSDLLVVRVQHSYFNIPPAMSSSA